MFRAKADNHEDDVVTDAVVVSNGAVADAVPPKVQYKDRSFTDKLFAALYILSYIAFLGVGIFMKTQAKNRFEFDENGERQIAAHFLTDVQECCSDGVTGGLCAYINDGARRLTAGNSKFDGDEGIFDAFLEAPQIIVGLLALAFGIAITWVVLLRFFAKPIVIISELCKIGIVIAIGIYQQETQAKIVCFVIAAAMVGYDIWARKQLIFAANVISHSTIAMKENPSIFVGGLLIQLLYAGNAALFVFFVAESFNVVEVKKITHSYYGSYYGPAYGGCYFEAPKYVNSMNIYMSLSYLWTLCLFEKMRLSIVATVVGAWHFHPEDKPSILVGIKNMATSFGTLSASALISSIAEYLNRLLNENTWASWIPPTLFVTAPLRILLCCCGTFVQSLVQMLTKFAVILHVFTGEAFVGSGKHVFKILKRHFKSGFVTEYTSKSLLTLASYAFSIGIAMVSWKWIDDEFDCGTLNKDSSADGSFFILYILVIFFTTWYPVLGIYVLIVVSKLLQDAGRSHIEEGLEGWNHVWIPPIAATFVGCISMLLFRFLSSLFLDIIDTLFLCFAIDKDNKIERSNDEFTELVKQMPDYTEVESVDSNQERA